MIHPITSVKLSRDIRPTVVRYGDLQETIAQPGWYAAEGDDRPVYEAADLRAYSDAWARLAGTLRNGTMDLAKRAL
jgi:hypothetical protein